MNEIIARTVSGNSKNSFTVSTMISRGNTVVKKKHIHVHTCAVHTCATYTWLYF